MPILVEVEGVAAEDLGQGDLLVDIPLFETSETHTASRIGSAKHALVISRDCAGANGANVVAACVFVHHQDIAQNQEPKKLFEAYRKQITNLRDGGTSPDRFYIGPFGAAAGRLVAHLDKLCTIKIPHDAEARRAWVLKHRVARLTSDFRVALPVRLFWAAARVGFDDVSWYATSDLRALVLAGQSNLHALEAEVTLQEHQLQVDDQAPERKQDGIRKSVETKRKEIEDFRRELNLYEEELRGRS